VGSTFLKENGGKKGEDAEGLEKMHWQQEFCHFFFTLSFFLLRSGYMLGRQQGWRICVIEGKKR